MKVSTASAPLTMHWVPVVDATGGTHLEAVWTTAPMTLSAGHAA